MKNKILRLKIFLDYLLPSFVKALIRALMNKIYHPNIKTKGGARLARTLRFEEGVMLGEHCIISGRATIGRYTFINDYTRIDSSVSSIGRYCSISHNVKLGMRPHPTHILSSHSCFYSPLKRSTGTDDIFNDYSGGQTIIGHDVFIASNSIVLAGVTLGNGCVVAAGAVVTNDVPPYAVVAGVPAKLVKFRFPEDVISKLQDLSWWNQSHDKLMQLGSDVQDVNKVIETLNDESKH